uniref:Uncharacterized protein n=1 Tax=Anguilla anguilla TaxID=7936 RepID=A0A0E9TAM9_ANGAN
MFARDILTRDFVMLKCLSIGVVFRH